jgi:putative aldouronate transport system permease protein
LKNRLLRRVVRSWRLYVMFLIPLCYLILFSYVPMYGLQLAFKSYSANLGIWGSPWIGFDNFRRLLESYYFGRIISNTIGISLYSMFGSTPLVIIFALMLNECTNTKYKKIVQTVSFAPYFISTVIFVSMLLLFLSVNNGMLNNVIEILGGKRINFMGNPKAFKTIYIYSGTWKDIGYAAVIYLAALSGVDQSLYEAAYMDGATRLHKIWHIDLPTILPTIVIMLILECGRLMSVGFEAIYLMQNTLNNEASEVISTYVYKQGIMNAQYAYSTAVGLFNSVGNLILLVVVNRIARKVTDYSLW